MKISEIISNVAIMLGVGNANEGQSNYNLLFRCANLVVTNVASNYFEHVTSEKINVVNGRIDFTKFQKTVLRVKSVKLNGRNAAFELFIDFIKTPNGLIEVEYAYVPKFTTANDVVSTITNISESALMYGIMAEYAYISGMMDEAAIWNKKLEESLYTMRKVGKSVVMP